MTKIKSLLLGLVAIATLASTTSCNSDNGGKTPVDNTFYDIVTVTAITDGGFVAQFREIDDSPLITLTFTQSLNPNLVKVGQRILLNYWPESGKAYTSGPATSYGYRNILNSTITEGTAQTEDAWSTEAISIVSLWRTGEFINVNSLAPYKVAPRKFDLVLDKSTLDDEIPTAYLLVKSDLATEAQLQQYIATFNISSIWNDAKYKGLRVVTATINGTYRETFTKSNNPEIITPEN